MRRSCPLIGARGVSVSLFGRTGAIAVAMLSVGALLAAAGTSASATEGVSSPMVWGASVKNVTKQTPAARVAQFETSVGRHLASTRDFLSWDSPFPTSYETGLRDSGHMLIV